MLMKENQLTTDDEVFTVKDFSHLPTAIQKYIESCGYIGTQKMSYLKMEYETVNLTVYCRKLVCTTLLIRQAKMIF